MLLASYHDTLQKLGMVRVDLSFKVSDLEAEDTILFLPAKKSPEEEGLLFTVQDPAGGGLKYTTNKFQLEARIEKIKIPGLLRFSFRDVGGSEEWKHSEFGPVRVALIKRPGVIKANIKEPERLEISAP